MLYIINRTLHDRLEIRNFSSRVKECFLFAELTYEICDEYMMPMEMFILKLFFLHRRWERGGGGGLQPPPFFFCGGTAPPLS